MRSITTAIESQESPRRSHMTHAAPSVNEAARIFWVMSIAVAV